MKKAILFLVAILCINMAVACDKSMVSGNVQNHVEDMHIEFYCEGDLVGTKNIVSKYGNYQKTLGGCLGNLRGDLYLNDTLIESKEAIQNGLCNYDLDYAGLTQTPEFTSIGFAIAGIGSFAAYKLRTNKRKSS